MFNNQEVGSRLGNDVGLLGVKDHDHDDYMINGLKWNNIEQFDIHLQVVPDLYQNHEILIKDEKKKVGYESLLVPDEHSETGDDHHHHGEQQQHHHDHVYYSNDHNKKEKQVKRRRRSVHQILMSSSDEESSDSGFTREVPSVTRKVCKRRLRRRREETMSHKILKLQQLLPNSHKRDEVSVLDNAIDYMKDLRLQIQVMSMMGINPYMASPYPNGMHNHLSTALTMSHGQIPANQATSPPFIPASNWPLTPITNLSSYSFFPQSPFGLVPCFPSFMDHFGRF